MSPSPYLPTTRRFVNPIYLRVAEVPGADTVDTKVTAAQGSVELHPATVPGPMQDELAALGDTPNLKPAARLLRELVTDDGFAEFLTLPAYELLH